jgi:hypothetical protein
MARLPRVAGLVFCESLDLGTGPGHVSLQRIFNGRGYDAFPTPPDEFVVYSALYGEKQEGKLELVATHLETEHDAYAYARWYHLFGEGLTSHLLFTVRGIVFPTDGRYVFSIRFDNETLTQRILEVYQKRS